MKSNAAIRIVIWSIVLVMLVGMLILLMFPWLIPDSILYDNPPAETAIPVPLETEVMVVPIQPLPNEETISFPGEISEIEIEWATGDIVIIAKDAEQITVSESDVTDAQYSLQYQVRDTKLEIVFCEDTLLPGFVMGKDVVKDLYIEVPMDWAGQSIEIDAADANVEMHNITLQKLDIDGADGTCDFQNCRISDLNIDTASGDVYFSGTLDTLNFDAASASFTGDLQTTPSRIDMDSLDGKLDLALPEDCGYTLTMDGMSIHLTSDFNDTSTKNGSHVYGDGRCRINVDGMSCDVTLRKLDAIVKKAR